MFTIRSAHPADASAIAALMQSAWPNETHQPFHIAGMIARRQRCTLLAERDGVLLGFIDAFGTTRWELDLMAVTPQARGQGIGTHLARACVDEGRVRGYTTARGLVAVDNTASQGIMSRLGLRPGGLEALLVYSVEGTRGAHRMEGVREVYTLRYQGGWIEPPFESATLHSARTSAPRAWQVIGAVIPIEEKRAIEDALGAGYHLIGTYQWWSAAL